MTGNYEPMTGMRWSGVSEQAKELALLLGLGTITFKPEINQHYLLRIFNRPLYESWVGNFA